MKKTRNIIIGFVLVFIIVSAVSILKLNDETHTQNSNKGYSFRTEDLLNLHYQKHGSEFGNITKDGYLQSANEFITSNSSDILTKSENDGDMIYYCASTNEFLVLSQDGYIRTYFKPDDGIEYYNRQ